jgi:hypothetical protein
MFLKASSGAGTDEIGFESSIPKVFSDWSADGRFMVFFQVLPKTGPDLWVRPMQGDRQPSVFLDSQFVELWPRFSPDGKWVTYQSDDSGRNEIYVRPFPGPGAPVTISVAGGNYPRWARNGTEIYFLALDGTLMATPVSIRNGVLEAGTPVALFKSRIVGRGQNVVGRRSQYDVAPDGRFLINIEAEDAATSPISLLLNWKPPAAVK